MIFLIMEKNKDILKTIDFLECDFWSQDWFFKITVLEEKEKSRRQL
jgi:hypothetical protein